MRTRMADIKCNPFPTFPPGALCHEVKPCPLFVGTRSAKKIYLISIFSAQVGVDRNGLTGAWLPKLSAWYVVALVP